MNSPQSLFNEISRIETTIAELDREIERAIGDTTVPMGRLLQIRMKHLELRAYLKGLRFHVRPDNLT
jgi:hypothetical protein